MCEAAGHAVHAPTERGLGVTVVNRRPDLPLTWLSTALSPRLEMFEVAGIRVAGVYGRASDPVCYSSAASRQTKRVWLADFQDWVTRERPDVLLGDLNVVDPEFTDRLPYVLAEEVETYHRLGQIGYADAFRRFHGPDVSWRDHTGVGCRYDHGLVIPQTCTVRACILDHSPRLAGLTDHSALILSVGL